MKIYILALLISSAAAAYAQSADCNPAPKGAAELVQIRPDYYTVKGPLADFDPCHRSVELTIPKAMFSQANSQKPPLFLIAHGGGGLSSLERNMARALNRKGYATLLFDAYQMNGFYQGASLFVTGMTNGGRQRMIFKATLGAYHWALKNEKIDSSRIYFHGVSNGGLNSAPR